MGGQRRSDLGCPLEKVCLGGWGDEGMVTQRYRELLIASYFGVWVSDTKTCKKDQKSLNKLKQAWLQSHRSFRHHGVLYRDDFWGKRIAYDVGPGVSFYLEK